MGKFEERSNDQKDECLGFFMEESECMTVLWSWVGTKEDVKSGRLMGESEGEVEEYEVVYEVASKDCASVCGECVIV